MSRTKPVGYAGFELWVYDASLSLLLAELISMVEELSPQDRPQWWQSVEHDLRVHAVVSDLYFDVGLGLDPTQQGQLAALLEAAADRVEQRGSFTADEAAQWKVLDEHPVIFRGSEPMSTAPVAELGRALAALLRGTLPSAPPNEWWYYGSPGGCRTIAMRGQP